MRDYLRRDLSIGTILIFLIVLAVARYIYKHPPAWITGEQPIAQTPAPTDAPTDREEIEALPTDREGINDLLLEEIQRQRQQQSNTADSP